MRNLIIFCAVCFVIVFSLNYLYTSGKFQNYLDKNPNPSWGVKAQYCIALHQNFKKNHQKSIESCDRILTVYPKNSYAQKALFLKGKNLERLNKKKEASIIFKEFCTKYPKSKRFSLAENKYKFNAGF